MSKQKKQHDKEKGNETSRKTQRHDKEATMTDGRKTQHLLLSALPVFFEKAF